MSTSRAHTYPIPISETSSRNVPLTRHWLSRTNVEICAFAQKPPLNAIQWTFCTNVECTCEKCIFQPFNFNAKLKLIGSKHKLIALRRRNEFENLRCVMCNCVWNVLCCNWRLFYAKRCKIESFVAAAATMASKKRERERAAWKREQRNGSREMNTFLTFIN